MISHFDKPDWIQAYCAIVSLIISLIGTIIVIISIRGQIKINTQQAALNHAMLEQSRREIRPRFVLSRNISFIQHSKKQYFNLKLTNAIARGVRFDYQDNGYIKTIDVEKKMESWEMLQEVPVGTEVQVTVTFKDQVGDKWPFTFMEINLFDDNELQYIQMVSFLGNRIMIDRPIKSWERYR